MFFVLSQVCDKEKILSLHVELNLIPSDSGVQCSTTEPQQIRSLFLFFFSLSHAREKTKNIFLYIFPINKFDVNHVHVGSNA